MAYIGREPLGGEVILMNSIESQFNGVLTTFNLTRTVSGVTSAFYPVGSQQLLVSLGGVIQRPDPTGDTGFRISFNTIIFAIAPAAGTSCFIISYGNLIDIGAPANNTVSTDKLVDGSVTPVKLSTGGPWWLSNGNVGIGTTNPIAPLEAQKNWTSLSSTNDVAVFARLLGAVSVSIGYDDSSTGMYLGTKTNHNLQLRTNNTAQAIITNSGNVGIGTTNPSDKLHVVGGVRTSQLSISTATFNYIGGSGTDLLVNGDDNIRFRTDNEVERMCILASGNVGIGTTNPPLKLTVVGNIKAGYEAATGLVLGLSPVGVPVNDVNAYILWGDNTSFGGANGDLIYIPRTSTNAVHRFYTGTTTPLERLRIDSTGNVGIGTISPNFIGVNANSRCLSIVGDGTTSVARGVLELRNPLTDASGNTLGTIYFVGSQTTNYAEIRAVTTGSGGVNGFGNELRFATKDDNGISSNKMFLSSSGNLSIGVASTTYKLEVNGSFAATTKSFVIPHPSKPNYQLRYACLEGPENSVYVRGRTQENVIELPDYWVDLVHEDSITVSITPVGNKTIWIEEINNNKVYINSEDTIDCHYIVFAERKDVEKLVVEIEEN